MTRCVEKKILLSGEVLSYECELLCLRDGFGILRHVLDKSYRVNGVVLMPGDVTYALYWEDRPYTLYRWRLERTGTVIHYFNVADSVRLTPREFAWRDLVVDLYVDDKGTVQVLDEDELPETGSPDLLNSIQGTKAYLLLHYPEIIGEAERLLGRNPDGSLPAPER